MPGQARFAELLDPTSLDTDQAPAILDQAVVTFFQTPHSYTSERFGGDLPIHHFFRISTRCSLPSALLVGELRVRSQIGVGPNIPPTMCLQLSARSVEGVRQK